MKASLKNLRHSPRKTRAVADLVKGESVLRALTILETLPKKASLPVKKLIQSAVANAKNLGGASSEMLIVKDIRVEKGIVLKRMMPRARGSAFQILRRNSHIFVELGSVPIREKTKTIKGKKLQASSSTP